MNRKVSRPRWCSKLILQCLSLTTQYWKLPFWNSKRVLLMSKFQTTRKLGQNILQSLFFSLKWTWKIPIRKNRFFTKKFVKYFRKIASYKMIFDFVLPYFSSNSHVKLIKCSHGYFKSVALFCDFYKTHDILIKNPQN